MSTFIATAEKVASEAEHFTVELAEKVEAVAKKGYEEVVALIEGHKAAVAGNAPAAPVAAAAASGAVEAAPAAAPTAEAATTTTA